MAGRRPKPLAIHQLNGNPRHFSKADLTGSENPNPDQVIPEMPKGILGKAGRREFKRMSKMLLKNGLLSEVDGAALMGYCLALEKVALAQKDIDRYGLQFVTHFEGPHGEIIVGDMKANPAVSIQNQYIKIMKSFEIEFGLTPASRSKLKIEKKDAGDEMESFLKRGKSEKPAVGFHAPNAPVNRSSVDAVGSAETVVNPSSSTEADPTKP